MRVLVKLLLVIAVIFGEAFYYNIYTLETGLIKNVETNEDGFNSLNMENFEYIKLSDDVYYISYQVKDTMYGSKVDLDTFKMLNYFAEFKTTSKELSYIPLGIGAVAILVIILFPKRKR